MSGALSILLADNAAMAAAGFSLVGHANATAFNSPITTGAIDTSGANLLVVAVTQLVGVTTGTLTDSKGNTWTGLTAKTASTDLYVRLYYCAAPTVGSGHTFTYGNGGAIYGDICVQAWSGANASPFQSENGSTIDGFSSTSLQPGAVTPSQDNSLIVTALVIRLGQGTNPTINAGYTVSDFNNGSTSEPIGMAYLVQGSAAASNPTWSWTGGTDAGAVIAVFKP